ncbi:hypothetical protein MG290_01725 [Flavobacterium sp. CBA20B-1]|uniref:hypothetical protein n=1 Tax=unclassified Flavobacterium TaxID=196869 RepID=UPI002225B0CA|nr:MULTISPECIES: hypothetical protein [unclassified Flavobacterium]WCM42414.1 hypothetical protein MG290_01725 [Flavobacterium sp. CBA20B-1]
MRKILFVVPFLFLGIKPYQQITSEKYDKTNEDLTQFEKDTLALTVLKTSVEFQLNVSEKLDERKQQLLIELKTIRQRERDLKRQRLEKRELQKMINDLEKFNNRGL